MPERLTGPQKAAILLLSLGEDAAAEVMKNLNEDEIRDVSRLMTRIEQVTPQDVERVTGEFYRVAEKGNFLPAPPVTKVEFLKKVLSRALGEERAVEMVEGLVNRGPDSPLEQLRWHDPQTIAEFIGDEHPQVIAVILAYLGDPERVQAVVSALPEYLQKEIFSRYAKLKTIPEEWLQEIEASLSEEMAHAKPGSTSPAAEDGPEGEAGTAGVVATAPQPLEDLLLRQIAKKNPELAERLKRRTFAFADLLKLDNYGAQLVLQRVPGDDLVLALKLADEPLMRHLLQNMSAESAGEIEAQVEALGPTSVGEIEGAQQRIATVARTLIEKGEIYPLERKKAALD